MQDKEGFFRDAEDPEKAWIAANEAMFYKRQRKSFIMLMILFAFCLTMGILGLFFPMGLGRCFCIVMIPISIIMLVVLAAGIACAVYGVTGTKIYSDAAAAMGSDRKAAMTYIQDPSALTEVNLVKVGADRAKAFLKGLGGLIGGFFKQQKIAKKAKSLE